MIVVELTNPPWRNVTYRFAEAKVNNLTFLSIVTAKLCSMRSGNAANW